jgi:nucleoside-diphosphate-sugar epimerase
VTEPTRVAAVTGASGYLGSRISAALEANGWRVLRLVRTPNAADPGARHYDIRGPIASDLLDSARLVVHAAYDFSVTSRTDIWATNVEGTRRLLAAAKEAGVRRTIVLSSMSAYEGTGQLYGQAKLAIEAATFAFGGCVVRPGLVYGDHPGGMGGALLKATRLPVVPLVAGNAHQFLVHEGDLVTAIAAIADADTVPSVPIGIAQPSAVSFRDLLTAIAAQDGRECRFFPVPWRIAYWSLRIAQALRVPLPVRADSLLGLVRPATSVPNPDVLKRLGVTLRVLGANGHASPSGLRRRDQRS